MNEIERIIRELKLKPHPEGGFYRETYRSGMIVLPGGSIPVLPQKRNCTTCIYFLLTSDSFSAFHRVSHDEIWHFYMGSEIRLHLIEAGGNYSEIRVGNDLKRGEVPQYIIPDGTWFAASVTEEDSFGLVGCTVSPGFNFDDFELARRDALISEFPMHGEIITAYTKVL